MDSRTGERRLRPAWWTLISLVSIAVLVYLCGALFQRKFSPTVPFTLTSGRAGLVMESGGKVKLRGIQVGRVEAIKSGTTSVSLRLQIFADQVQYIPANVQARIRATTAFGAKYVDLIYPADPSPQRIRAGAVLESENVSTEVNTVFENLVGVIHQIDPAKLNSVLSAVAEGVRGQGDRIGEATTAANQVLLAINPRSDASQQDWRALKGFSDAYGGAAQDILKVLDAASTTSANVTSNAAALDSLLLEVSGFAHSGIELLGPNKDTLIKAVNVLEPTTALLLKYSPSFTCMLLGGKHNLDAGAYDTAGGNGKSLIVDAALLLGDDPYKYPDNLPITGARGGPGGVPSCGSLPNVAENWPQRQLITNTGWGTGTDLRPNPGIGYPGFANYLPTTRGIPQPPTLQNQNGPAPGPIPYPGAPPYGARQYAPDGTPLYPGLPPAPAPGLAPDPGPPPPGSEPSRPVAFPAEMPPTPIPRPSAPPLSPPLSTPAP